MAKERVERHLAAILAADVAGYSQLMGADEEGTHERLKTHLGELVNPNIRKHRGRIVKNTGDGFLAEFGSVMDAVRCAVEVQRGMANREPEASNEQRIRFRIGINLSDVIAEQNDIFGDGVNVAARLETLAEPGGICVSRAVRDQVRDRLGYTFEDMGEQQVKNIARPVRAYRIPLEMEANAPPIEAAGSAPNPPPPFPDKPSIAVLPFANLSGDPEQEYFADGMVEEIITALSRIRSLFVIARNSTFTYKGQAIDVKQVGRELGVRYLLEGSVRKWSGRVRITAQLIDATSGTNLWADRFDGSLEDIFDLQDKVALSVAGVIEPTVQAAETARVATRRTSDLTAYDLYLRALSHLYPREKEGIVAALELLEQAIERQPRYGPALALGAMCHEDLLAAGWTDDPAATRRRGLDLARRALRIGGDDPTILVNSAAALAYFGEDIDAMMALVDRALALNPSFARGWHISGVLRLWAGQPDLAIEHIERSLRFSPRGRIGMSLAMIGAAHFVSRRFNEAVASLLVARQEDPSHPFPYRVLASCYALLGLFDKARETVEHLRTITPAVVPSFAPFRNSEHRELFLSGLRLAADAAT